MTIQDSLQHPWIKVSCFLYWGSNRFQVITVSADGPCWSVSCLLIECQTGAYSDDHTRRRMSEEQGEVKSTEQTCSV